MKRGRDNAKRWLEERRIALPVTVWSLLKHEGYVDEVLAHGEDREARAEFEAAARVFLSIVGSERSGSISGPERDVTGRTGRPKPVLVEAERAVAISGYLSKVAGDRADVRQFRADVLGGGTLTGGRDVLFLNSPAIRFIPYDGVPSLGITLADHRACFVVQTRQRSSRSSWPKGLLLEIRSKGRLKVIPFEDLIPADWQRDGPPISWRLPRDQNKIYLYGSVFDRLMRLSSDLAQHYGWRADQAQLFIVSGKAPRQLVEGEVNQAQHEDHAHYHIRLTIQPWVSAKTVSESYRFYQRTALGGECRPLSSRNMALFCFVTQRMPGRGAVPSWRSLMNEWNRHNPKERYAEVRQFHRDYSRMKRKLVFPDYVT